MLHGSFSEIFYTTDNIYKILWVARKISKTSHAEGNFAENFMQDPWIFPSCINAAWKAFIVGPLRRS